MRLAADRGQRDQQASFRADLSACPDLSLRMHSITYRIATGAQAGRKVTTLQTIPADADAPEGDADKVGGFSLHAGVAAEAHESQKLERLCSYIARPGTPHPDPCGSLRIVVSAISRHRSGQT